jgi:zinc protease
MMEPGTEPTPLLPLSLPPLAERQLGNGLNVVAIERTRLPLVCAALSLSAGCARDPRGKAGLADFALSLLRRGTARHSAAELNELLELIGADLRLETAPDSTLLSITAPSEHAAPMLELLAELVQEPSFPATEVRQARARTVARLHTDQDDPSVVATDAAWRAALGRHPYSHPGRGLVSEVRTFTREDCVAQHRALFRPAGARPYTLPVPYALPRVGRREGYSHWKTCRPAGSTTRRLKRAP